jgi:hypothetical protein
VWLICLSACSETSSPQTGSPANGEAGTDAVEDSTSNPDAQNPDADDAATDADQADADVGPRDPLVLTPTFESPTPAVLPPGMTSCPIYGADQCVNGVAQSCDIYDTEANEFPDVLDPMLERAYLFDRWYDMYNSPVGLTMKRVATEVTPAATPESEWGAADAFSFFRGGSDAAIWTGTALASDTYRYMTTGSEADYERVEKKTRDLLRLFDVTGIPGYLARYHFLMMPDGGPTTDTLIVEHGVVEDYDHTFSLIEDINVEGLPAEYAAGLDDGTGALVSGTPMWKGVPTIDQYSGPWVAFPMVLPLLRDEALKARITEHLTCYLKRLQRLEIINLQDNPDALDALAQYFAGGELQLDPDDIDLLSQDTIVGYYHPGFNALNAADFDRSCPDTMAVEPTRVVDAAAQNFPIEMVKLALDLDAKGENRPGQIDHFYAVNVRGADAGHLLHMTALAYWMTGEQHYNDFLFNELVDNLRAPEVALTASAFRNPPWCFKFYSDHISYTTHWQFLTMLPPGELKDTMVRVMHEEYWDKAMRNLNNAKFNVLYASTVPESVAGPARQQALDIAIDRIETFGGNGGILNSPRRGYPLDRGFVVDNLPAGTTVRCPTEAERSSCEDGSSFLGVNVEGWDISYACDGRPGECVMDDGDCVEGMASEGLPSPLLPYGGFMWQLNTLQLGSFPVDRTMEQGHGRDFAEPYWLARYHGYISEGGGQLLAWKDEGSCN